MSAPPMLNPEDVHVWLARVDVDEQFLSKEWETLDEAEQQRARRYRIERVARRFIAARLFVRQVLGWYLALPPRAVRFRYSKNGKPELDTADRLQFNLSHSGEWAAIGVALDSRVGIDIEVTRGDLDLEGLARRFFTPEEARRVEEAKPDEQAAVFFLYWTCKEAYLKACGDGLLTPLDSFRIDSTGEKGEVTLTGAIDAQPAKWSIQLLKLAEGISAAVAWDGGARQVRCGTWRITSSRPEFAGDLGTACARE